MRPQDTAYIIERLAVRFMAMVADHERQLAEHRAAFGARTEADAKIIAGLRQERDGLLTQVQDMRAEITRLSAQLEWERAEIKRLQWETATMHKDAEDGYAEAIKVLGDPIALSKERDALRAEVAALQERLRASIARGDFAQMEVAALKSQRDPEVGDTVRLVRVPTMEEYEDWEDLFGGVGSLGIVKSLAHQVANVKYNDFTWEWPLSCVEVVTEATHDTEAGKSAAEAAVKTEPVADEIKVGDLVEVFQATDANWTRADEIGIKGTVQRINMSGRMIPVVYLSNDGAYALRDVRKIRRGPKPGDTVRLVRIPSRDDVSSELKTELEWPWIERWGTLNQTALVVEPAYQLDGALSVCLSTNVVHVRWPISCIEVITEATHDTEAGKAAAQNAEKTEQVADEIKVGDLVEVVSSRGCNTWLVDVGSLGIVTSVEDINDSISVHLDNVPGKKNALAGYVSLCDVRKVTT